MIVSGIRDRKCNVEVEEEEELMFMLVHSVVVVVLKRAGQRKSFSTFSLRFCTTKCR